MQNFVEFLLELDAQAAARLRVAQQTKDERLGDARMSDQKLIQKRAEEIRQRQQSDDPIDRQIAALQNRIDQLLLKKKQNAERLARQNGATV